MRPTLERLEDRFALHGPEDLVPLAAVTHTAVASGSWSAPATWQGGQVPGTDANVHIPAAVAVTVDDFQTLRLRTVRVDGTLQFAAASRLFVDTVIVMLAGIFRVEQPNARVTFADRGPIDTVWDHHQFSRGLVSMGTFVVAGRTPSPFLKLATPAPAGATTLSLDKEPFDWRVGDRLVVPGTTPYANQDEQRTITALTGTTVTLSAPLAYTHAPSVAGLPLYVAHVTRDAVFESESMAIPRRGHVMVMHRNTSVVGGWFKDLGRTDKSIVVNPTTNVRGRYPLHVHRTGIDFAQPPVVVRHTVIENAPGWGLTSHSSYVVAEDNVTLNAFGAGFVAEAGNEIGSFRRNIAVRTPGVQDDNHSRDDQQDYGFRGDGFWLQGGNVEIKDNVAAGAADHGYMVWARGLVEADLGNVQAVVPTANLVNPAWAMGKDFLDVQYVPLRSFAGNVAYACGEGMQTIYLLYQILQAEGGPGHTGRSVIDKLTVWGVKAIGVDIPYTEQLTLQNSTILGDPSQNPYTGTGVSHNLDVRDILFVNNWIAFWLINIL